MKRNEGVCGLEMDLPWDEEFKCPRRKHGGPSGRCIFHAPNEEKSNTEFWEAFEGYVDYVTRTYERARSEEEKSAVALDCRKFIFPGTVGFLIKREFEMEVNFGGAEFTGEANFTDTTFHRDASFGSTTFYEKSHFLGVTFKGKGEFLMGRFRDSVYFYATTFDKLADFRWVSFDNGAAFFSSTFKGEVLFAVFDNPEVTFNEVDIGPRAKLVFTDLDLGNWLFAQTPAIEYADFINVRWRGGGKPTRKHTLDEKYIGADIQGTRVTHEAASEVYRRLRSNYEKRLAYGEAGEFFIGEMVMYRKDLFSRKKYLRWLFSWLYNLFSRYGESIWLPLGWLIGLFATAGYFYWLSSQGVSEALRSSFLGFVSLKIDLGKEYAGWLIPSLQRIIGIPLITLFILALRRAFRR